MPLIDVTTIVFTWASLPAWYASRPWSISETYLAPVVTSLLAFQVHVFLNVGVAYEPAPTETLRAEVTCACVRSEQASSGGPAFANGAMAAATMKMAAMTALRLIFEGMSESLLRRVVRLYFNPVFTRV